jgi:hypothetical protein
MKQAAKPTAVKVKAPKTFAWSVTARRRPAEADSLSPRGCDCGCGCSSGKIARVVHKRA